MFSQSGTQTPVPSSQQPQAHKVQFHEILGETVTWVNDWYLPNLTNSPTPIVALNTTEVNLPANLDEDRATPAISDSIRLKGWHKINKNHKQDTAVLNPNDILDLTKWKYFREPLRDDDDEGPVEPENPIKKEEAVREFGEAIKFDKEDNQF
ncbi:hypothetical protein SBY92_004844 [Candida maltosa Xu316]